MRDEGEGGHEQQQHGGAVLRVSVDLPGHPDEPEQARRLEQADERGRLREGQESAAAADITGQGDNSVTDGWCLKCWYQLVGV